MLAPVNAAHAQTARSQAVAVAPRNFAQTVSLEPAGFDSDRIALARMDACMQVLVDRGEVVGVTTLLARHGQLVSFKFNGRKSLATGEPMTRDTIFRQFAKLIGARVIATTSTKAKAEKLAAS